MSFIFLNVDMCDLDWFMEYTVCNTVTAIKHILIKSGTKVPCTTKVKLFMSKDF